MNLLTVWQNPLKLPAKKSFLVKLQTPFKFKNGAKINSLIDRRK